jgi:hypothetical protein
MGFLARSKMTGGIIGKIVTLYLLSAAPNIATSNPRIRTDAPPLEIGYKSTLTSLEEKKHRSDLEAWDRRNFTDP